MSAVPRPSRTMGRDVFDLFLISFLALFFEMIAIRWLASEVRVFAYLKNLPLLASFLGLGLGCALAPRPRLFRLFPVLVLPFCAVVAFAGPLGLTHLQLPGPDDYRIWNSPDWLETLPANLVLAKFFGVVIGIFLLVVGMFAGLGERLGAHFGGLPPLLAYSINLVGSLLGIWAFSLLSFLGWPPAGWFLVGFTLCIPFLARMGSPRWRMAGPALVALALAGMPKPSSELWSPYYRIELEPIQLAQRATEAAGPSTSSGPTEAGWLLSVNHDYHQKALNLSDPFMAAHPDELLRAARFAYDLPFRLTRPSSVLVVGAGMGNDVAAALRAGATSVDAVEIDPTILDTGRRLHPERPYDDSRVNLIVDDARSFFKRTDHHYDLVVFGLLDAHTVLSSFSSIRLDSYVYTEESLREAAQHLNPNGVISIGFWTNALDSDWLGWRLHRLLSDAMGQEAVAVRAELDASTLFAAGPGVSERARADPQVASRLIEHSRFGTAVEPSTDDWPFLYLRQRGLPWVPYGAILLGLLAISMVLVTAALGRRGREPDWQMLFLGAGFMLIEVKGISQLSLLFGSTWIVNSVVIAAILVMALTGNAFVAWQRPSSPLPAYALLGVAILLDFALPRDLMVGWPFLARALLGAVPVTLPIAFAGVIFAAGFSRRLDPANALGWNLLGALIGGLIEYISMVTGFAFLGVLALGLYGISLLTLVHGDHTAARTRSIETPHWNLLRRLSRRGESDAHDGRFVRSNDHRGRERLVGRGRAGLTA